MEFPSEFIDAGKEGEKSFFLLMITGHFSFPILHIHTISHFVLNINGLDKYVVIVVGWTGHFRVNRFNLNLTHLVKRVDQVNQFN